MNLNKKISVIIPVYNTEKYFDRCIKSILSQSYDNLEIIVVNDGSPGNIDEIIEDYKTGDKRIVYLSHEKNQGLFKARVTGMKSATGDYIAFVDSDDYISYDFYRTLIDSAEKNSSDIVISRTVWEDAGSRYVYNYHESCFQFDTLVGNEIKEAYFGQEANCYSWHTVWNKLYSAELVKRCLPVFEGVKEHVIMTEDICFSSIFFYEAEKVSRVYDEAYFYCSNEDASTNTAKISLTKFLKNMSDMITVFNYVDGFLEAKQADSEIKNHFKKARLHYARMWQHLLNSALSGNEKETAHESIVKFCDDFSMENISHEYFFESVKTPWNGALEFFKEEIGKGSEEYISFDIFDTLILRPFYRPEDLFNLLDKKFRELTGSTAAFSKMRKIGESIVRSNHWKTHPGHEDITLTEIYQYIADNFNLDSQLVKAMQDEEIRLEIKFAEKRKSGYSLFETARHLNKKVLLVTDMYLERDTIEAILKKNGYTGYERLYISCEERKLKYNAGLFNCVIRDYPDAKGNVIHIGDTWKSDIEGSKKAGFKNLFLPKAKEVFENKIQGCVTNRCASLGKTVAGTCVDTGKILENMGIKCMLARISNKYFDNPYRTFHEESDLNADPYFIGYYVVGMHLLGLCKWMDKEIRNSGCGTVHFLSRDGYLPMKGYELYKKHTGGSVNVSYLQTSRKALMPFIVKDKIAFYQLPVEFRAHTAETLLKLLEFASNEMSVKDKKELLKKNGIKFDEPIKDDEQFCKFINWFLANIYSPDKHKASCDNVRAYFRQVNEGDIAFDMGYSGRIQAALSDACGHDVDVLFLHEDYASSNKMKAYGGFDIRSFYDFRPSVTGLFREHVLSDCAGSCIGYTMKNGVIEPVIENESKLYADKYVVKSIEKGTLDFMEDFFESFGEYLDELDFSPIEASYGFEGFIRHFSNVDLHIFSSSYFEDEVYGAQTQINIEEFLKNQTHVLDVKLNEDMEALERAGVYQSDTFIDILNRKGKASRALLWALVDPGRIKEKVSINIKRILKKD